MLKYKTEINNPNFVIPINLQFDVGDKEESVKEFYIEEQVEKNLPPQEDYEIAKYFANNIEEIVIKLYKFDNVPYVLSDFGFTDDDVKFFYNRLQQTFLSIFYYDVPNKLQRSQKFQVDLFIQRFRLYNSGIIKTASEVEVEFHIKNPKTNFNETEGFFIYLMRNNFIPNFNLYCNFRFNSALDGISNPFYLKKSLTTATVKEEYEYLECNFSSGSYVYNTTDKTASYNGTTLNIDLYALV